MQTRVNAKRALYAFDSLPDLQRWIDATPETWFPARDFRYSVEEHRSHSWDLNAGYAGALRMARDGWIEGAERVQDALKVFALATPEPDTKTDFYGFRPHVARFCAGAPDCMVRHTPRADNGSGKVLTLIVGIGANAYTDAQAMANYGTGIAQYVNQMETNGTRVEVYAAFSIQMRSMRIAATVRVKYVDQPLDLANMAFAIGHPAMFRRLCFSVIERCAAPAQRGYGTTVRTEVSDLINAPLGSVVLNGMVDASRYAATPEDAYDHISKEIEKAQELAE